MPYLWTMPSQKIFTCSELAKETLQKRWVICSKLIVKTLEWRRRHWRRTGVFTVNLEQELRVCDSWITIQFIDPTNQKFVILSFFTNRFFPKHDNFKLISISDIYLSICLELNKWDQWKKKMCRMFSFVLNYVVIH